MDLTHRHRSQQAQASLAHLAWAKALFVMVESVARVVITSGSSMISMSVPSSRARAANNSGSNAEVLVIRTPE